MSISLVFGIAVVAYTAMAAATDIRSQRIPNYLTVPAALAGLAFHLLAPSGWGILVSLAGFGVGFALLLLPALMGGSGMGDVKLLAALGAWLGPAYTFAAFALAALAAAAMALAVLGYLACTRGVTAVQNKYVRGRGNQRGSQACTKPRVLPFAVPVALSTWLVLAWIATQGPF